MRELNVNEIEQVSGGDLLKVAGILGAIDMFVEFMIGFAEAIEDVNEEPEKEE